MVGTETDGSQEPAEQPAQCYELGEAVRRGNNAEW